MACGNPARLGRKRSVRTGVRHDVSPATHVARRRPRPIRNSTRARGEAPSNAG